MRKKRYSKAGSKPAKKFNLFADVDAITRQEREAAQERQRKAGITEPVRTNFKRPEELDPGLNAALDKIWKAGSLGDGKTDRVLRLLYSQISRGLTCFTTADVLKLAQLNPEEMRAVAFWIVRGKTLKEATWAADQKGEQE